MVHAQTTAESRPTRDIPVWLTIPIVLLCLGGGSYLVYRMVTADDRMKPREITRDQAKEKGLTGGGPVRVPGMGRNPGTPGGNTGGGSRWRGAAGPAVAVDGVTETLRKGTSSNYTVAAGSARMEVVYATPTQPTITLSYANFLPAILNAEQYRYLEIRKEVIESKRVQQSANVTAEQIAKLDQMPKPAPMKATAEDLQRLTAALDAWKSAPADKKAAAEKSLVATLDEVAKNRFEETKSYATMRVEMIKSILTADQINQLRNPGAGRATPVAKPVPAVNGPAPAGK